MNQCTRCNAKAPAGSRFCPSCATPLPVTEDTPTLTSVGSNSISSSGESRFLPGAMLGGRYRIVGQLGRGGMGEVYRADDVKLGQPVALKFLPPELERDPGSLTRLLNEVRTARQVTHPNVCRVYDVGEIDGQHFISMEYVDGEDLAVLLRRIGRLPEDKALQIARQLCAGLAAAHEEGILHRDLKPANVMLDGRGRVRITDFGLAGLAEEFRGRHAGAGTPTYMAPEQLSGRQVSTRSDLYALGLVLYELFTGKRAFSADTPAELIRLQQESAPSRPTSLVSGLDETVERVILQCLENEPGRRPGSALAVAAALPGGDPLAAALAAGETPSPQMLAAAGPQGSLKPAVGVIALFAVLAGIVALAYVNDTMSLRGRAPLTKSPHALAEDARDILEALGYAERPTDSASWFDFDFPLFQHFIREGDMAGIPDLVRAPGQSLIAFHYRQSRDALAPSDLGGVVRMNDPPREEGDIFVATDLSGRLIYLHVVPDGADFEERSLEEADWSALFRLAGLELEQFEPTRPTLQPSTFADSRRAWQGTLADFGDMPSRIEAASLHGRPVHFERILPADRFWSEETSQETRSDFLLGTPFLVFILLLLFSLLAGAVLLALHNLRRGRGDRRGALRLALVVASLRLLAWLLRGHHVADLSELGLLIVALAGALVLALITWLFYVALEPYVRRLFPGNLVAWSRLLAGRVRDPLVGRELLAGITVSVLFSTIVTSLWWWAESVGWLPQYVEIDLRTLQGGTHSAGQLFSSLLVSFPVALGFLLLLTLLRVVLRRLWLSMLAFFAVYSVFVALQFLQWGGPAILMGVVFAMLASAAWLIVIVRFGLVATMAFAWTGGMFSVLTADATAFYFAPSLFLATVVLAVACYGFFTALAGQPVFRDTALLESEHA